MRRFRVDVHAHLVPSFYRQELRAAGVNNSGGAAFPSWTPPAAMRYMDRYGIQAQVVCLSEPGVSFLDGSDAAAFARQVNEYEADLIAQYPTRFGALAVLPMPDGAASAAEAAYALDTLELDGVVLLTRYDGRFLGDPAFDPLYAELDRRGAYVFIHPAAPPSDDRPGLPFPVFLFEFTFDTTRAVTDLLRAGVFQRYPRIRWQLAHAGGTVPYLGERLANAEIGDLSPEAIAGVLRGLFYDTALSPAPTSMLPLREVTDLDHIVFGSDWPFAQALNLAAGDPQPELSRTFSAAQRRGIERDHALAQLPRLARRLEAAR